MNKFLNISTRLIATFIAVVLSGIGAGSVIGISALESGLLTGVIAVAKVVESLARAYSRNGRITLDDIDKAFGIVQPTEHQQPVAVKKVKPKAG